MADFEITSPDGKKFVVTAPEGATQEQVLEYAKSQFSSASQTAGDRDPRIGGAEALLSLATGGVAAPLSGIAGGAAALTPGLPAGTGADVVRRVGDALTYRPRSELGRTAVSQASMPFEWLAKQADKVGDVVLGKTGSPPLATVANTAIQALPLAAGAVTGKTGPVKQPSPAALAAHEASYAMTPKEMGAGVVSRTAASLAGEPRLARSISLKNQPVHNRLIAQDLKLPPETILDRDVIKSVRASAGEAFENARSMGVVELDAPFKMDLARITAEHRRAETAFPGRRSPVTELVERLGKNEADSSAIVSEIRLLRRDADKAYASRDFELARASKDAALALEDQLIRHAEKTGHPTDTVSAMRESRKLIAKSYAADRALVGNNINPQVYASELRKGRPLTGGARTVGEFANQFPRSAMNTRNIGETGPTAHDLGLGLLGGIRWAGQELPFLLARPAIRETLRSAPGQAALMNIPGVLEAIRHGQASPLTGLLEMSMEQP